MTETQKIINAFLHAVGPTVPIHRIKNKLGGRRGAGERRFSGKSALNWDAGKRIRILTNNVRRTTNNTNLKDLAAFTEYQRKRRRPMTRPFIWASVMKVTAHSLTHTNDRLDYFNVSSRIIRWCHCSVTTIGNVDLKKFLSYPKERKYSSNFHHLVRLLWAARISIWNIQTMNLPLWISALWFNITLIYRATLKNNSCWKAV